MQDLYKQMYLKYAPNLSEEEVNQEDQKWENLNWKDLTITEALWIYHGK